MMIYGWITLLSSIYFIQSNMEEDPTQPEGKQLRVQFDAKALEYYSYLRTTVETNQISYWIGNPSVSIINGLISLAPLAIPQQHYDTHQDYLQRTRHLNLFQIPQGDSPTKPESQQKQSKGPRLRSQCMVLCGIPNSKNPVQILENSLFGQYRSEIIQMRVIKTVQLRYYALLLRFQSKKSATYFFNDLFGRQYNEIEMECIVLREMVDITVSFSQILKDGESNDMKILRKPSEQAQTEKVSPQSIFTSAKATQSGLKGDAPRQQCSICLQEIGVEIISILCGHYFHCRCLERWEINTCPLCRYHQQPPVISFCQQCNQCEGLWVCLICGLRLCCGSTNDILAQDSHIYQHYKDTGHGLSMELQTKFIFDARVPAFLHQMFYRDLIRKGAGNQQHGMTQESVQKDDMKKNKLSDKISLYESQVAEQMQKQRSYFQESLNKQVKGHKQAIANKKQAFKSVQKQLERVTLQLEQNSTKGDLLAKSLEQAQRQQKIITSLQKMHSQKIQKCNLKLQKARNMQRNRLIELEHLIEQRKAELLNYKQNLALKDKINVKLKGQGGVQQALFLMAGSKKKKK